MEQNWILVLVFLWGCFQYENFVRVKNYFFLHLE